MNAAKAVPEATVHPVSASTMLGGVLGELLAAYVLIYVLAHIFTEEGREQLKCALSGLKSVTVRLLIWGGVGFALFHWYRHKNPSLPVSSAVISTIIVEGLFLVGFGLFLECVNRISRGPREVRQSIRRGRELGTIADARDALGRHNGHRGRGILSRVLAALFDRDR